MMESGSRATHAMEPWLQLENKVVMVTGASSGLGRDFCLDLAKAGCRILAAARRIDRLQSLCGEINKMASSNEYGPAAVAIELDVGSSGSVIEASVQKAWDAFGRIDALINNAGVRGSVHSPLNLSEDEWNNTIKTNLTGTWLVSKYVCTLMRNAKKGGSVINISSIAGLNRGLLPGCLAYAASKTAVNALTNKCFICSEDKLKGSNLFEFETKRSSFNFFFNRSTEVVRYSAPRMRSLHFSSHCHSSDVKHKLLSSIPEFVKIVEVGPRDGLQNEKEVVPTAVKVELIKMLVSSGLPVVEATSFVSPKWVPQLADAKDVLLAIRGIGHCRFPVLTPNLKGFEAAIAAGAKEVAVFASASESFSKSNINCTIEESLARYRDVTLAARNHSLPVRGYISCVVGCPVEGAVPPSKVAYVAQELVSMGCAEISLGDTIGVGTPGTVIPMLEAVLEVVPVEKLAVHFHDTYGQALSNIFLSLQLGIGTVDSSVSGLGGCPYAKGATGNVATEDVVYMLNGLGVTTNVDLRKVMLAGDFIGKHLGRCPGSKAAVALSRIFANTSKL